MYTLTNSRLSCGWYLTRFDSDNTITELFSKLGEPSATDIDDKVEYEWTLALYQDSTKLCDFTFYDYHGDRWHIGGDDNTEKYLDTIVEVLRSIGL